MEKENHQSFWLGKLINKSMIARGGGVFALLLMFCLHQFFSDLRAIPNQLGLTGLGYKKSQVVDRHNLPISYTYENDFNVHFVKELHEIPEFLQIAFIAAEDRRFFTHSGVDWLARAHAFLENIKQLRVVRGASTISEQVVKMHHKRPRSIWTRLLEGVEAERLEGRYSKSEILEFYLNQVPYARRRRGVAQAALMYFDRDLNTLSEKEMLALAVLVRAPSRLDLYKRSAAAEQAIEKLSGNMHQRRLIDKAKLTEIINQPLELRAPRDPIDATHFVQFALSSSNNQRVIRSSLDTGLQKFVRDMLEQQIASLKKKNVGDGAVLIVENNSGEILSWVNAGDYHEHAGNYDAVTTLRQPGSTLKPFLYALSLETGWSAATLIYDGPLEQAVGSGLHGYRNYSGRFYGSLRLRDALGNSLNSPAVRTVAYVGRARFVQKLRQLGFDDLKNRVDFYGDGIALGNAEVTLYQLVRAYLSLARSGNFIDLSYQIDSQQQGRNELFSEEVASLIADILSDKNARSLEFSGGALDFPTQTAIKTGTSNDYRDAWALGFNNLYTVGVWMGNLDNKPMIGVSGSIGPAPVMRSIFAKLSNERNGKLFLSRKLNSSEVCELTGKIAGENCPILQEWFRVNERPSELCDDSLHSQHGEVDAGNEVEIALPTDGLRLARDPRIPDDLEVFSFEIDRNLAVDKVDWILDGENIATTSSYSHKWKLSQGSHELRANVWLAGEDLPRQTAAVKFFVN